MKTDQEKLWDAVGMLDGETVQTAMTRAARMQATHTTRRANLRRRAVILTAACLLLLIAGAFVAIPFMTADAPTPLDTPAPSDTAEQPTDTPPVTEDESREPVYVSGDFSTDIYDVTEEDGVCYLNFKDGNRNEEGENKYPSQELASIGFSSMDEMYRRLKTGDLTPQQIYVIKNTFTHTEKGIIFPNVNDLLIPALPDGCFADYVTVIDDVYSVGFHVPDHTFSGGASIRDEGQYRALYEKNYTNVYDNDNLMNITLSTGEFDGIPCEIGDYQTKAASLRNVRFTLETEGKTLSILVYYCLDSYLGNIPESDTCPQSISIYCEQEGKFATMYLSDFQFAPTVEWLSSFGLTLYVPTADSDLPTE